MNQKNSLELQIKKPKQNKFYFTDQTEQAIIKYNSLDPNTQYGQRNKLFQSKIYQPLCKLCQNIIHTYKLYYFQQPSDIIKLQAVSYLVLQLSKYDKQRGKAFSFLTKTAFYYLINANNKNFNDYKTIQSLQECDQNKKNVLLSFMYNSRNRYMCNYDTVILDTIQLVQQNMEYLFNKDRDKRIAYSIIQILKR